jgi:hypothetical protein
MNKSSMRRTETLLMLVIKLLRVDKCM